MPHFSPMNWIVATFLFWALLLIIISQLWWSNSPKFSQSSQNLTSSFSNWNWS